MLSDITELPVDGSHKSDSIADNHTEERLRLCVTQSDVLAMKNRFMKWPLIQGKQKAETGILMVADFLFALRTFNVLPQIEKACVTHKRLVSPPRHQDMVIAVKSAADVLQYLSSPEDVFTKKRNKRQETAQKRNTDRKDTERAYKRNVLLTPTRPAKRRKKQDLASSMDKSLKPSFGKDDTSTPAPPSSGQWWVRG